MKKIIIIDLAIILLLSGCDRSGNLSTIETQLFFDRAEMNGKLANEGFNRCLNYVNAWLELADSATGLIPSNIIDKPGRDIWNAKDCAAKNYPFMVLTTSLLDHELYNGKIMEMLATEKKLTSRLGSLPDTYSFSKKDFANKKILLPDIIFGSAKYVKDGLIPLTELLGPSPWSERMISIMDDIWKYANVKTPYGNIISDDTEVNGYILQSLSRIYWITGNKKYLEKATRIGDYYLLGKNHPTRNFKVLRLRDSGCEIVSGLCELYATVSYVDLLKKEAYKAPLYEMLDRILAISRNNDGLFYNSVNPVKGIPVNGGIADNFGHILNGFYTVYLLDNVEKYREPVLKVFSVLNEKYRYFPWEGSRSDGYADAIEGALNLYAREEVPSAEQWINSEIKIMWNKQQQSGIIEGRHYDGNYARTTIMYCLWKTQGSYIMPWRTDIEIGAVQQESLLYMTISAVEDWDGRLIFDRKRHSEFMHMPVDWPRKNQFPEYFTVDKDKNYQIKTDNNQILEIRGEDLQKGYRIMVRKGTCLKLIIKTV